MATIYPSLENILRLKVKPTEIEPTESVAVE